MEMTPEQQEIQEKLKNMSPEEMQEFQKQQCIFCQMIAGKVQVKKVYEDDKVMAILDINPANPGHLLLLPKEHYMIMPQIPGDELAYLFSIAKELSHALLRALGIEGTNLFVANGVAAGQRAQHFMIHIIPRMDGDNVGMEIARNEVDKNQILKLRKSLADVISKATGVEAPKGEEVKEEVVEEKKEVKEEVQEETKEEQTEEIEEKDEVKEEPKEEIKEEEEPDKKIDEILDEGIDLEEKKPSLDNISKLFTEK